MKRREPEREAEEPISQGWSTVCSSMVCHDPFSQDCKSKRKQSLALLTVGIHDRVNECIEENGQINIGIVEDLDIDPANQED